MPWPRSTPRLSAGVEGYMRPGCVHVTLQTMLDAATIATDGGAHNLRDAVKHLLERGQPLHSAALAPFARLMAPVTKQGIRKPFQSSEHRRRLPRCGRTRMLIALRILSACRHPLCRGDRSSAVPAALESHRSLSLSSRRAVQHGCFVPPTSVA